MNETSSTPSSRRLKVFALAALVNACDQITKHIASTSLPPGEKIAVTSFLGWRYVTNEGAAFGWLREHPNVLTWVAIMATLVVCVLCLRADLSRRYLSLGLALVLGGATGNLIDRFRFGYVVDFLSLHVGVFSWPEFNVADIAVTVGAFLVATYLYFGARPRRAYEAAQSGQTENAGVQGGEPPTP